MSYKAFTRFKCLVRDQEVDGSNPFAPTTSFKANNLQRRKVPTTSWLCAKRSVVPMSSPNDLHFPLQIGVKWRDAATTFSLFCSPRSPNRTGFGMGRLKPRPTFSPHSRYGTSSRRASVARAHVVVLMGHPVSRNANVINQKRFLIAPSVRFTTQWSRDLTTPGKKRLSGRELPWRIAPVAMFSPETKRIEYKRSAPRRTRVIIYIHALAFSELGLRRALCLLRANVPRFFSIQSPTWNFG